MSCQSSSPNMQFAQALLFDHALTHLVFLDRMHVYYTASKSDQVDPGGSRLLLFDPLRTRNRSRRYLLLERSTNEAMSLLGRALRIRNNLTSTLHYTLLLLKAAFIGPKEVKYRLCDEIEGSTGARTLQKPNVDTLIWTPARKAQGCQ